MSIAASVVLRPSLRLRWLCAGLRCAVCLSALVCPAQCWSLLCIVMAAAARGGVPAALLQLDITAGGQWYLSVYQYTAQCTAPHPPAPAGAAPACVAVRTAGRADAHYLRAGTLIWPCLLLLHLGVPGQPGRYLPVLPDSVSAADWRALMLASRALAARSALK
ncbi:hypothetical protein GTP23_09850 [Pseudoduganella sp. FT93W]|uniref:Uncharacterized protein n=1 Tax=Duganella fentianensis TaxID=2692177 RepID=A0A845I0M7_9BURK|nr:protein YgfX [Duganella fentianensis]MYN45355.1 hypothetical protein [Duganella fentianensis]